MNIGRESLENLNLPALRTQHSYDTLSHIIPGPACLDCHKPQAFNSQKQQLRGPAGAARTAL